jgi:hypothetical protein
MHDDDMAVDCLVEMPLSWVGVQLQQHQIRHGPISKSTHVSTEVFGARDQATPQQ